MPPPLYLKIFTDKPFTSLCVQQWLDVCEILGSDIFIICEKPELIDRIQKECHFQGKPIASKVFFSAYFEALRPLAEDLVAPHWVNAAVSHLTTFQHAKEHGYTIFWNIDADDTFFSLTPKQIALCLKKVEKHFHDTGLSLCSLDMWHSINNGNHWSFGVCLTRNIENFKQLLLSNKKNCHTDFKKIPASVHNLDFYLTFLSNYSTEIRLGTFYIKNAGFTHFGIYLQNRDLYHGNGTAIWHKGLLYFPFLQGDKVFSFKIPEGVFEVDIGLHDPIIQNDHTPLSESEFKLLYKQLTKFYFYKFFGSIGFKTPSFKRRENRTRSIIESILTR